MDQNYRITLFVHIVAGSIALASYWLAALARKGSPLHRGSGKAYLGAMTVILASSSLLAGHFWARGKTGIATFLTYLVLITATAMWLGWRATRMKRDQAGFRGPRYLGVALLNVLAGVLVCGIGLRSGNALLIGFSQVGIVVGAQMLWRRAHPLQMPRWWLKEHFGAMLGCGVATHIAFLGIGLRRILAAFDLQLPPQVALLAWFLPIAVAVAAGLWLDRRYLGRPALAASVAS